MRKTFALFFSMMMAIMLVACGNNDGNNSGASGEEIGKVTIELLRESEEKISREEVALFAGDTLMDVMDRNFEIETVYDGQFIHGINGIAPEEGENYAWIYTVNGEEVLIGATEYELEPGDFVEFDYISWD